MGDIHRRKFLVLAGTVGGASLAGCQAVNPGDGTETPDDTGGRPLALSESSGGSLSESDDVHSGWIHVVADGETYGVTFDLRVCHGRQTEVTVDLTEGVPNEYVLKIETSGEADGESDCSYGTRLNGGGTLPTDFESIRVAVNGRTVQRVEKDGTLAVLRPLPDPVET